MNQRAEQIKDAREKAKKMTDWFTEIKEDPGEIIIDQATKIVDFKKFVASQAATLLHWKPLSSQWRQAYMRLYTVKQILQKTENDGIKSK